MIKLIFKTLLILILTLNSSTYANTISNEMMARCWSIPLGMLFDEKPVVKIKLKLNFDGTIDDFEILERPKKYIYNAFVDSVVRAIKLCAPYNLPSSSYERWKEQILIFDASHLDPKIEEAERLEREKIQAEKFEREKKAKRLAKIEENKIKIKKFYEEKEKKVAETQKNLNFINNFNKINNLIKLNCFEINKNTHFRIFIDDKLKKAVEIYPSGEVTILHTVRSDDNYFRLDLHSVKISSGFYSKEDIIINKKYADEEIRYWVINRHTGISQIKPIGTVINDKVFVMDDTNQPTGYYYKLDYMGGEIFNCSKKSF